MIARTLTFVKDWSWLIGLIGGVIGIANFGITVADRWRGPDVEVVGLTVFEFPEELFDDGIYLVGRLKTKNRPVIVTAIDISGKAELDFRHHPAYEQVHRQKLSGVQEYISWVAIPEPSGPGIKLDVFEERFVKFGIQGTFGGSERLGPDVAFEKGDDTGKETTQSKATGFRPSIFVRWPWKGLRNGEAAMSLRAGGKSISISHTICKGPHSISKKQWMSTDPQTLYKRFNVTGNGGIGTIR